METNLALDESTKSRAPLRFHRADWLALALAALCAGIYAFSQPALFSSDFRHLPGIGLTFSVWLLLGACAGHCGWRALRWTRQSLFLLAATLLLSLTYARFANEALRLMNLPVLAGLVALTATALRAGEDCLSARGFSDALRKYGFGCLRYLFAPFRGLHGLRKNRSGEGCGALILGLLLCIPVVGLAAVLLCDADAAFDAALVSLLHAIGGANPSWLIGCLIRAAALTLLLFAFIYGFAQDHAPAKTDAPRHSIRALSFATVLAALDALYVAFLCVQLQQLGTTANYANSARAGFFQLVLVALITVAVALPALCLHPESRALRILAALAALLTGGILACAAWRMADYIRAYGWTLLRATTLWGMLAVAAALLGTLVKCARPRAKIFRALAVFTIVSWTLFNGCNVDARIAEANVAAYLRGAQEALDVQYLASLSPDVLPALEALKDTEIDDQLSDEIDAARASLEAERPNWYDWSLSWNKLSDKAQSNEP